MKKKGLIISTVVMVVVLIASLTTATYAWFSSQAVVRVDSLNIKTVAAEGLQIAMENRSGDSHSISNIVSGELEYNSAATDGNRWLGEEGWGQYLGFGGIDIGQINNAITKSETDSAPTYIDGNYDIVEGTIADLQATTTYYTATEAVGITEFATGVTYYWKDETNKKYMKVQSDETFGTHPKYYTIAVTTDRTTEDLERLTQSQTPTDLSGFVVPTGYDTSNNPTGFNQAVANQHYYELTMVVKNTSAVNAIGMGVMVRGDNNDPHGMVAASRIEIEFVKASTEAGVAQKTANKALEPYSDYVVNSNGTWTDGTQNGDYKFQLDKAEADSMIAEGQLYYVVVRIWVEGTDSACNMDNAGSGFTVNIEFVYTTSEESALGFDGTNAAASVEEIVFA